MRPEVSQGARAGVLALQPPGQRRQRVDEPVLEVGGSHVPQRTQPALGDQRARVGEGRHLAVVEADDRHLPAGRGAFGGRGHRLGLRDGVGEGLLAQHVLARLQSGDGDLRMTVARGADVDQVHVVPGDQGPPVRLRRGPSVTGGRGLDRGAVAAADRGESRSHRQVEDMARGTPALRVGGAHERVSDHADAQCRHLSVFRRRHPGLLLGLFSTGHADFLLVDGSVAAAGPDQLKPVGRYRSMLSLLTTAEYRVTEVGISISARPATPLLWPSARARSMAEAAMVGG